MDNYYHQNPQYAYEASARSKPRDLKLIFSNKIASPVFTKDTIAGGDGGNEPIEVFLVDSNTMEKVTTGSIASTKVKIVLLHGDGCITTSLEFKEKIVVDYRKKKNLLLGNLYVDLENGCGTVGKIRIKHDRNPLRNAKFRLGAMVVDRRYEIKEAITNPFYVKDRRNLPKCLGPRSLEDKVWQLSNISKKGKIYKRLKSKNIFTVKNLLDMHFSNPLALQEICRIKGKKWDKTITHAKTSLENVCNACGRIGSTSQQLKNFPSFDDDDSIVFDNNCYKPQPCEDDVFVMDSNFSTKDVEMGDIDLDGLEPYKEDGVNGESVLVHSVGIWKGVDLAKRRWVKLRTTWLLIRSFMKLCIN